MDKINKWIEKVNTNVVGKNRGWTKVNGQSYDFFTDDFFIKHVSLGFNIYQRYF